MKVIWLKPARDDLVDVRAFIAQENPYAAHEIAQLILEASFKLADFPHMGKSGRVPNTRELVIPGLSFVLAYRVSWDRVEILSVMHQAREWPGGF